MNVTNGFQTNGALVGDVQSTAATEGDSQTWTLQYRDLPEVVQPGRRQITSRLMADIPITSGDPVQFMKALDYTYVTLPYAETLYSLTLISYKVILRRTFRRGIVLHTCLLRSYSIASFCPRSHFKYYPMSRVRISLRPVFWTPPVRTFYRQQCGYRTGPWLRR